MKLLPNKKYNVILKYVIVAIIITLLLVVAIFRWDTVKNAFSVVARIFSPIVWGAVIAFIMNPIMVATEKFLGRFIFRKKPHPKISRAIGVAVALIVFIAVIMAIVLSIIPEIMTNVPDVYAGITNELIPNARKWVEKVLDDYPSIRAIVMDQVSDVGSTILNILSGFTSKMDDFLNTLLNFANSVKNFIFGIIIAIYFLLSKESLQAQAKKAIVACFRDETYRWIFTFTSNTNNALLNFIYGKIIDSIIIGMLCCIGMLIFDMPYVMIISIIIGITNIIPIFGPFIGAIPSAILILISEPRKVIWFILFVIFLQQLDGNIIGPRILGSKIGLSPFWMLFAIIIFGSMFGIAGMIVGVPLFAVAYDLIGAYLNSKLEKKNMPTDNSYYSMSGTDIGRVVDDDAPIEIEEKSEAEESNEADEED